MTGDDSAGCCTSEDDWSWDNQPGGDRTGGCIPGDDKTGGCTSGDGRTGWGAAGGGKPGDDRSGADRSEACIGCPDADETTSVGVSGGGITGPAVAGTGGIGTGGIGTGGTLSDWSAPGAGIGSEASCSGETPAGGWPAIASYCAP